MPAEQTHTDRNTADGVAPGLAHKSTPHLPAHRMIRVWAAAARAVAVATVPTVARRVASGQHHSPRPERRQTRHLHTLSPIRTPRRWIANRADQWRDRQAFGADRLVGTAAHPPRLCARRAIATCRHLGEARQAVYPHSQRCKLEEAALGSFHSLRCLCRMRGCTHHQGSAAPPSIHYR